MGQKLNKANAFMHFLVYFMSVIVTITNTNTCYD